MARPAMKLLEVTCSGTTASACTYFNQLGLADYVICAQFNGFGRTVAVLKVPNLEVPAVWQKLGRSAETCPVQYTKV